MCSPNAEHSFEMLDERSRWAIGVVICIVGPKGVVRKSLPRQLLVRLILLVALVTFAPDKELLLEEIHPHHPPTDGLLLLSRLACREDRLTVERVQVGGEDARDARDAAVVVATLD